jgi:hypothetical protein
MKKLFLISCLMVLVITINAQQTDFPKLTGPYLGQKPPGMTPEIFAPGIILDEMDFHSCPAFSKDGNFVFWKTMNSSNDGVYYMERRINLWRGPQKAQFLPKDADVPYFPYDDCTLFFISANEDEQISKRKIWYTRRTEDKWEKPKCFTEFNPRIDLLHWQFTFSKSGNIYFTGIKNDGYGNYDLFYAKKVNGKYIYEIMPEPFNSTDSDICPYIAKDESYIIFSSVDRKDGFGKADLYICYKKKNGKWTDPINMGSTINSKAQDHNPMVTKDGNYLFFLSFRSGKCHPYWVSAKIIEELRPNQ